MRTAKLLVLPTIFVVGACTDTPAPVPGATTGQSSQVSADADANPFTSRDSTFSITYRLDGKISASSTVGVDIPTGAVVEPKPVSGKIVTKGEPIGTLKAIDTSQTDGTVAQSQRELVSTRLRALQAPVSGVAQISPTSVRVQSRGLDVVVPLKPLQELRYRGMNFDGKATVETVLGQRQSACVAVWIEKVEPAGDDSTMAAVHCRLAPDLETASGLPAVLTLTSAPLTKVVTVPLLYISLDKSGQNYVVRLREGSSVKEQKVVVGPTDGVRRVVTHGLTAGDVLLPIPTS